MHAFAPTSAGSAARPCVWNEIEEDLLANAHDIARVRGPIAVLDVVLDITSDRELQFAAAMPLPAQMAASRTQLRLRMTLPR